MADLAWLDSGTAYFAARLDGADLDRPSRLPGWTGRHLVAHVACNASALGRLAHWARTGEETPMYASAEARAAEIEEQARLSPAELLVLAEEGAARLRAALEDLSAPQWEARVRTAQGRMVPASEIPWMRAREMWIHAVDLGTGGRFEDFPPGFVDALLTDVTELWARRGQGPAVVLAPTDRQRAWGEPDVSDAGRVSGTAAELAAWVTGRGPAPDPAAPALGRWL
ncbi:maleylpyruvate isomerase family mycothiol-dependent enzyme [Nonomuraea guangzhouensis]|uniref:Maleylpyruvate isomerase family mycothiol-dependent enzyme n=1 Tax=Nonomuraea guangzhouensis TaxID=1291555 RepID=A0ABW4GYF9_9ACTN|nr:maleylpyruvate isomerase family mycothiol-dependent enzyme [Nonomuraea guangzhouensis]